MAGIAFVVISSGSEPSLHRVVLQTPSFDLSVVAVPDYHSAIQVVQDLYVSGIDIIELCGGFGIQGAAAVSKAVPDAHIGVVRFDGHPGLSGESGDKYFDRSEG